MYHNFKKFFIINQLQLKWARRKRVQDKKKTKKRQT